MLADQGDDVGRGPDLGDVLVGDAHGCRRYRVLWPRSLRRRSCRHGASWPLSETSSRRIRPAAPSARLGAWPFGARPSAGSAPRWPALATSGDLDRRLDRPATTASASTAWAAARRAIGTRNGRAAHVVEAGPVEEGDRLGVAAVLAAHAELQRRPGGPAPLGAQAHQLADAVGVDRLERVALQQPLLEVGGHHPALDVVAAEAERHLGQVVGAEGEEVGLLGDLAGPQRGPGRLDHGADGDLELAPLGLGRRGALARSGAASAVSVGHGVLHPAAGQGQLLAASRSAGS